MTDADPEELRLVKVADGVAWTQIDLTEMTQLLEDWLSAVTRALADHLLRRPALLRDAHALTLEVDGINKMLATVADDWSRQWTLLEPARRLAQAFDDRVMLLVFGKFNAGKSSLCNLLAERFVAHGRAVTYFHLEAGHVVRTTQPLLEGATETTARLQGVSLGHGLVLLDTPGQHSVTPENAALTQRFTDSADAVLWLTSSTSPGQVQELDEMARELHRCKPLLPVITRSDLFEEDEVHGKIVKLLRNKTPNNRRLQEDDVRQRAWDKLTLMDVPRHVLKPPVSISTHTTREQGETPQAIVEGGFRHFYSAVLDLIEPARAYKQRKPIEVLLHHLEENVLGTIRSGIAPALGCLADSLLKERERLQRLQPQLARSVWRQVAPELPRLLERHAPARDVVGLCRTLGKLLWATMAQEVASAMGDHDICLPGGDGDERISIPNGLGYEVFSDVSQAGAGDMLSPHSDAVVVHHERLHDALQKSIHRQLANQIGALFERCTEALDEVERSATRLQETLAGQDSTFREVKRQVRDKPE